ncbi:alkaline phosphatase D family protein [Spongisporangium articulatum]|uniref:Alkaline phosphatase D family protein n=1 Tax=Spongisporangium articulatum TaxID=3362603 RepID=A0ABW8AMH6_9ACTN
MSSSLVIGPLLRHVGRTSATVWVEVAQRGTVRVTCGAVVVEAPTFEVAGHHYALAVLTGLPPGSRTPYAVDIDGRPVWPPERGTARLFAEEAAPEQVPDPVITTLDAGDRRTIAFGSCRVASPGRDTVDGDGTGGLGIDALDAFAVRAARGEGELPDLLLMLGDQVYADETGDAVRERIRRRRGDSLPRHQVADFEEYTWLYRESWGDGPVRWLMATTPVAMIFDDHDVHDDWNTSASWRADIARLPWWRERLLGGLVSYWVYQHLGNLSPEELALDPVHRVVAAAAHDGSDAMPALRELAADADAAVGRREGGGYRFSFWRDLGVLRLVVLDSRCGRVLVDDDRDMLADSTFDWLQERLDDGGYRHLAIGTSVPWLLTPTLHAVEAWNERSVARGGRRRVVGERLRRLVDLEHWAAFGSSFERLAAVLRAVGSREGAPRTVSVLSGDVHHSYVSRVDLGLPAGSPTRVHQLTCSPVHNLVPRVVRIGFTAAWSRPVGRIVTGLLHGALGVPRPTPTWQTLEGPVFGNCIATLRVDGDAADVVLETPVPQSRRGADGALLRAVARRRL